MSSILFAIVILSMLVAIIVLFFKPYKYGEKTHRFKKIGTASNNKDAASDTRWRSVKIRPGLISCDGVAEMEGQVYLSSEAPTLPLGNCGEKECRCHYIYLEDRRSGSDRRIELGRMGEFFPSYEQERRLDPGRRLADVAV